jgi:hypothetical protein
MESSNYFKEKRKYPRVFMDWPLDYRMKHDHRARGGLVVNASETGLLIFSPGDIPIGAKLKIAVLFPKEYELANFEVFAEIIWKKPSDEEEWNGYQYGIKFIQVLAEDHWKLKQLLSGQFKYGV